MIWMSIISYLIVAAIFCGIVETRKGFDVDDYWIALLWPVILPPFIVTLIIFYGLGLTLKLPYKLGILIGKTKFMRNLFLAVLLIGPASPIKLWRGVENKLARMPASELCQQSNVDLAYKTGVQLSLWTDKYIDKKYLAKMIWTKCGPEAKTKEY